MIGRVRKYFIGLIERLEKWLEEEEERPPYHRGYDPLDPPAPGLREDS